jgi:hypothetical protein
LKLSFSTFDFSLCFGHRNKVRLFIKEELANHANNMINSGLGSSKLVSKHSLSILIETFQQWKEEKKETFQQWTFQLRLDNVKLTSIFRLVQLSIKKKLEI